ncbi:MAG: Crp/Fnr family transcriptional regulator [Bdellovibrionales bacterium]|nr:Crp/Fnr family transcriptional regulator [Bdellovibrionales bacterium]
MNARDLINNSNLRPLVRHVPQGTYLFRQGETAKTMFLILKGRVRLIGESGDGEIHVSNRLHEGEMLGERVIASSRTYPRSLTAFAETDVTVLEFSLHDFQRLQVVEPLIASLMFKNVVQLLLKRWDETRELVRLLRPSDNTVRVVRCIGFFCRTFGKPTPGGVEVIIDPKSVHHYVDLPISDIETIIAWLAGTGAIKQIASHCYLIRDSKDLETALNERAAA